MINQKGRNIQGIQLEEYAHPHSQFNFNNISEFSTLGITTFYHYTPLDACINILNRNSKPYYELWASHLEFLNDTEEYKHGLKIIRDQLIELLHNRKASSIIEDFLHELEEKILGVSPIERDVYIICFSLNPNSLTQWKYYGKNCGIAIGLNLQQCKYSGFIANDNTPLSVPTVGPFRVIYDNEKKKKIVNQIINSALEKYFQGSSEDRDRKLISGLNKLIGICPLFKDGDFSDEEECRLIFRPIYYKEDDDISSLFNYRNKEGTLLPYFKIQIHPSTDLFSTPIVSKVIIGPGQNKKYVYSSIKHMIERKNPEINLNSITVSPTPFRG